MPDDDDEMGTSIQVTMPDGRIVRRNCFEDRRSAAILRRLSECDEKTICDIFGYSPKPLDLDPD